EPFEAVRTDTRRHDDDGVLDVDPGILDARRKSGRGAVREYALELHLAEPDLAGQPLPRQAVQLLLDRPGEPFAGLRRRSDLQAVQPAAERAAGEPRAPGGQHEQQ